MMKLKLYSNAPSIDLHGMDSCYAKILVKEFLSDNYFLKEEKVVIIHGIGAGIVKKAVHEELKRNKLVKEFRLDNFNPGATLVVLKVRD